MARSSHMNDYEQGWSPEGFLWAEDLEAELEEAAEQERADQQTQEQGGRHVEEVTGAFEDAEPSRAEQHELTHRQALKEVLVENLSVAQMQEMRSQMERLNALSGMTMSSSLASLVALGSLAGQHSITLRQSYSDVWSGEPLDQHPGEGSFHGAEVSTLSEVLDWTRAMSDLSTTVSVARGVSINTNRDIAALDELLDQSTSVPATAAMEAPGSVDVDHSSSAPLAQATVAAPVVSEPASASEQTASVSEDVPRQDVVAEEVAEPEEPVVPEPEPEQPVPSHAQLALAGQIKSRMRARVPVSSIADGLMLRDGGADLDQVAEHCRVSTSTVRRWYATAEEIVVDQAAQATQEGIDADQESAGSEPEHFAPQVHKGEAAEDTEPEDPAPEVTGATEAELESRMAELDDIFGDGDDPGARSSFWDGFDG